MSSETFRLEQHPQRPLVTVAEVNVPQLVAVGTGWFATAFELAFGDGVEEVCRRFSDDLRAVLVAYENKDAGVVDAESLVELVRGIQYRLAVASEWAERLDTMNEGKVRRDSP